MTIKKRINERIIAIINRFVKSCDLSGLEERRNTNKHTIIVPTLEAREKVSAFATTGIINSIHASKLCSFKTTILENARAINTMAYPPKMMEFPIRPFTLTISEPYKVAAFSTFSESNLAGRLPLATNCTIANRHITVPLLKSAIISTLTLGFIYTFKVFDLVYVMTGGGPGSSTEMLSTLAYRYSFGEYNFSRGAAIANVLFVLLMIIGLFYIKIVMSEDKGEDSV